MEYFSKLINIKELQTSKYPKNMCSLLCVNLSKLMVGNIQLTQSNYKKLDPQCRKETQKTKVNTTCLQTGYFQVSDFDKSVDFYVVFLTFWQL